MRYYTRYSRGPDYLGGATVLATKNKVTTEVMTIRGPEFVRHRIGMSTADAADIIVNLLQDRERRASYEYWAANRKSDPNGWPEGMLRDQRPEVVNTK